MAGKEEFDADWQVGGETVAIEGPGLARQTGDRKETAYLTVIRGTDFDLGRHIVVDEIPIRLGRSEALEFPLQDHGISRLHAQIEAREDGYLISDLGSKNGTRLNGEPVEEPVPLRNGDKVFLADTVLRFALADDLELGFQMEVAQLVGQDPLTGLESKRRFDAALDYSLERAARERLPLTMLMMDMDGVKRINDTHGHLFGAYVIGDTGRIIKRVVGERGRVCRFGGDEFSAFVPGATKEATLGLAEAIRLAVENAGFEMEGHALKPTLSIGVASYPGDANDSRALLAKADAALYRAKAAGKNRVAI